MQNVMNEQKGYSLIELMIAMAIASIMMVVIYQAHNSQIRASVTQSEVLNMQQNIRAAMYYMERAIRMAGFDPGGGARAGVNDDFPNPFQAIGPAILANYLAFTVDANENGTIDVNDSELFAYRLNGDRLEQFSTGAVQWQPIAENVDAVNFVYLDRDGNPTNAPTDVRSIQVTMVVRSGDSVPAYMIRHVDDNVYTNQQGDVILGQQNDNFRRMRLTSEINCRNLY
jgi:type IV pilus assembly protein PilW